MPIKLWSDNNDTLYSDVFTVPPGKVVILNATGLEGEKVRVTDIEFKTCQSICVRRIVHNAEAIVTRTCVPGDWIVTGVNMSRVVDNTVHIDGACWILTPTNNLRIIGIPGTYYLALNDATAIGTAQVWAELVDMWHIPAQVSHSFF